MSASTRRILRDFPAAAETNAGQTLADLIASANQDLSFTSDVKERIQLRSQISLLYTRLAALETRILGQTTRRGRPGVKPGTPQSATTVNEEKEWDEFFGATLQ